MNNIVFISYEQYRCMHEKGIGIDEYEDIRLYMESRRPLAG